jgi:glycosyltransferase involved in cell wall biosynthesis
LPDNYLLNVGAVEKRKNQGLILSALSKTKIDIPLVIIGKKTEYFEELKQIINRENLHKQVIFPENVSTEDLPAIYQGADIFVYPSVFEGFGIPILEALNSRVPVITSLGSCFYETGGDNSVYIDHTSDEALSEAILSILSNQSKKTKMIQSGLVHAEKFSEERIASSLMDVYLSVKK